MPSPSFRAPSPLPLPGWLPALPFVLLLTLLPGLFLVPAAVAQEGAPARQTRPGPDVFGEVIEVRVVNLEVVVTDRDGNRVIGLQPEDFRLSVDGEEVPIDYFSEIVGGRAVETEAPAEGTRRTVQEVPAALPGEAVGTRYLVFVDDEWSITRDRNRILQEMADDLSFLGPEDRMAIVAFDGRQVEMLTSWTDSARELRRALSDAQARPARGLQRVAELRSHDRSLFQERNPGLDPSLLDLPIEDRVFANQVAGRLERSVDAVVATLRGFARPPGRKVMLLLSGGWPFSPTAYATGNRRFLDDGSVPFGDEIFAPVVDTANLVGYTVYPVDVPGLGTFSSGDVSLAGRTELPAPEQAGLAGDVSVERESTVEASLRFIARETGGEALLNARGREALASVAQDTRSYYWLGFTPERQRDDERHEIRVEVTRPGLRVRTRENFLDMSAETERTMSVESALLFGDPAAEGNLLVEVGEPERAGFRKMEVPLTIAIPTDLITVIPAGEGWVTRLELRVAALDESERRSDVPSVPLELVFAEKPSAGKLVPYRTRVKLRRTEQVLVVSITDVQGGRSLTTRVDVAP